MNETTVETIDVDTLRCWLEQRRKLAVLDVRPADKRAEWWIPGSLHVDAYDALWAGERHALDGLVLPSDRPIVVVCGAGRTSVLAARQLCARGLDARSLERGMQAWSLAWNTARLDVGPARVIQVRRTGKGCLSHLVARDGAAVVIDPSLPASVYRDLAAAQDCTIAAVVETHVHADHLSRAVELAEASCAELLLPRNDRVSFPYSPIDDRDELVFGGIRLRALRTPGHTPESTCYLLADAALFSGDTLALDGVGRPDLLDDASRSGLALKARTLYGSLARLFALPPRTMVLPCHTGAPVAFDGLALSAPLGAIRKRLDDMLAGEQRFVEHILAHLPAAPANHRTIVELNEAGRRPDGDPTELEAGANRCAVS